MAVNTILIDFSVDPSQVKSEGQLSQLSADIENVLRDYLANLKLVISVPLDGGIFKLYQSEMGAVSNLRIFGNGIITINIEYYKAEKQEPLLDYEQTKEIEQKISLTVSSFRSKMFPPLKRGSTLDVYLTSSDERLLEYDIDQVVFEERTQYQKVQIVHSRSLGNMLVLDDLQNISEADLIYTETLMCRGKEDYKDKDIVILGGGDGALLYELLKEKPKNVIMLEIDDIVMKACAKHMRSICGDVLDSRSGPNYQIIVGDCMKSLDQFISEGRKFDYVFGDLTDIPISSTPSGELWDFILRILELSFKILKPDGKFMTHGNGTSCEESLKMYESQLMKLQPPVAINKTTAFVPSFLEDWVFYQINFTKKP
ncbi:PREDICTED: spermine synthase isoform X2 [Nicrophorus vespilloides]|uniref:Spermine synthase isoform X2 n=1 Tax=Nicrophorus vespilloides TaxID=110193 RepID=A0ABM1MSX2_NICVS|nr:PREDICTED: spermine synthase isoform X2 [Nicrophorus vespilloides]